jgi:hypothetical protein
MVDVPVLRSIGRTGDALESRSGGPLKVRQHPADIGNGTLPENREEDPMKIVRRLLISIGAIAAFMMAAGAGWKN